MIIGLLGKRRAGKDTIADYLCALYGFQRMAFADPLKGAVREIFGFSDEQLNGDQKEIMDPFWGTSPREVLQVVGTDLFRVALAQKIPAIGSQIWVRAMSRRLAARESAANVVVSDVRFPDEARVVREAGGILVRVSRTIAPCAGTSAIDAHASETSCDAVVVNYSLDNSGTFEDLYGQINEMIATQKMCQGADSV